ncbi:DUF2087 domain-containing protein [Streptomyces fenghuangensis]|uniref:DUF2087 domain-containing protein n=1 Tax=Streptomyces chitinivorans TaxID=1257027 RepID=A0ABW7HVW0_9ACTN|nr:MULTISPECIES: DUF2087 domain-containing protein [Streptomyces]MCG3043015.1 DUF2087 domain-containing protein [Streptomyces sp. ICN903]MDH2411396.1 DUF2087 domain-containing protein [Streptomyces chitinivorans]
MTSGDLAGLFAEPRRLRAFAALVLGAGSVPEVARTAGLSVREAAVAVRRLRDGGLVVGEAGGGAGDGLRVEAGRFRELARARSAESRESREGGEAGAAGDPLHRSVRDGRIVHLPARKGRRLPVLEHVVERSFETGRVYGEREVDDRLRAWCEGGATDHVTVRRYLIDECLLGREDGRYWRP